jgi:hypothetical protein
LVPEPEQFISIEWVDFEWKRARRRDEHARSYDRYS